MVTSRLQRKTKVLAGKTGPEPTYPAAAPKPRPYSKYKRPISPGTIPRGDYAGLPRRPGPDRHRYLSLAQVGNLTNAFAFADSRGRALSVQITVAWDLLPGFEPDAWSAHQTRLLKAMAAWLRCQGIEPTWVWTREVSSQLWCHTHIQLHIPRDCTKQLAAKLVKHLGTAFGFLRDGIREELGDFGMWTAAMRAGGLRYLLKGICHADFRYLSPTETENVGQALGVEHRGTQGTVPIKRAGTTENIGKAARRAAGWIERRTLEDLRAILVPVKKAKPSKGLVLGRRGQRDVILRLPDQEARRKSLR